MDEDKLEKLTEVVKKIVFFLTVSGLPETNAKMLLNDLHDISPFLESKFNEEELG